MPATSTPPDIPFPIDAFPPTIANWLHASAAITRVPASAIAFPFLAGAGATIGSQLAIKLSPGWIEYPILWVALVGATGLGKTPALDAAREPFDILHNETWARWRAACDATRQPFRKRAALPRFNRLIVAGGPIADLTAALKESVGVVILRDELSGLIRALDRRSGFDRQAYLSLWSAALLELPDDYCLLAHVVGIAGGLQPRRLQAIHLRERDGLLERFLLIFLAPNLLPWNREVDLAAPEPESTSIVETLRSLRAIPGHDEEDASYTVTLEPEAASAWEGWFNANIEHIGFASATHAGFVRKLPAHLARIALVLHALWNPVNPTLPVTGETMQRAVDLTEFIRIHLQHAAALLDEPPRPRRPKGSLESRILTVLDSDPGLWLGRSQLLHALGRPETTAFDAVIAAMLNRERIESRTTPGRGRTATEFRLHPPGLIAEILPQ